jgi:hypothetical protein
LDGVLFDKLQSLLILFPGGKSGSYTVPSGVSSIGILAFYGCSTLSNVTIPGSVSSIGMSAFSHCSKLQSAFFLGDVPAVGSSLLFDGCSNVCCYLPGKSGWGAAFAGRPAYLWNPTPQTARSSFGVRSNRFGFDIAGTENIPIVVEATADVAGGSWVPQQACSLTNGCIYFSDPAWTNFPARAYRIRAP